MASFNFETHNIKVTSLPGDPSQDGTDATGVVSPTGATGIRGWLSGIYNLFNGGTAKVNATLTGSNVYESYDIVTGKLERAITFEDALNNILVINKGEKSVLIGLSGNSARGTIKDDIATEWTFTGTWTARTDKPVCLFGNSWHSTNETNAIALFNPNALCQRLTTYFVTAATAGTFAVTISSDGTNWYIPSAVLGTKRSDDATGTALDSIDTTGTANGNLALTYTLPYPANWQIKLTVSSEAKYVYVDAGAFSGNKVIEVNASESIEIPVSTSQISLVSDYQSSVKVIAV